MRKLLLCFVANSCLLVSSLQAQTINKTYYDANRRLYPISSALLQELGRERIFTSMWTVESNGDQKLMITKTDENGNFINSMLQNHAAPIHRIVSTADNCLLLVTTQTATPAGIFQTGLTVMKLDVNLNVLWSRTYPAAPWANASVSNSNIDVAKHTRGGTEYYYIVYSTQGPLANQETGVGVAKINGAGTLSWHRVYSDALHTDGVNTRDLAGGITMFDRGGGNAGFAIVGRRESFNPSASYKLFYMNIDENGTPVSNYKSTATGGLDPTDPDIAWDGTDLVTTYIEENTGIVPNPNNTSGIGFIKTDVNYSSFNARYYWQTCENYGRSITIAPDGNYVIGGLAGRCSPTQPVGDYSYTPMFLKISRNTFNPISFKRYNKLHAVRVHGSHIANATGSNYIAGEVPTACTGCPQGYRLLKVDANLNDCGATEFPVSQLSRTPSATNIVYGFNSYIAQNPYAVTWSNVGFTYDDCSQSTSPDAYRPADVTGIDGVTDESKVTIAPTLLRNSLEQVTCTVEGIQGREAEITVHNLLGQRLYSGRKILASGTNHLVIPATFSRGINIVRIAVDGKLIKTSKIDCIQ